VILSDRSIRDQIEAGRIVLDPFDASCVQPASVDLRLDRYFRVFLNHTMPVIDVKQNLEELTRLVEIDDDRAFILHPGEFVLGSTLERVGMPDDLVARVEGKSSLGRLGLLIHSTAGFVDPGFDGHITLELSNVASLPITLYPGMKIGQVSFMRMTTPADVPYGAGGARMWMEETIGKKVNDERAEELIATGASKVATACPFCFIMLDDGVKGAGAEETVQVADISMHVLAALEQRDERRLSGDGLVTLED
jgi:dCTP deaminase